MVAVSIAAHRAVSHPSSVSLSRIRREEWSGTREATRVTRLPHQGSRSMVSPSVK